MNNIFQKYFFDDPVFGLVAIPKSSPNSLRNNFKKINF